MASPTDTLMKQRAAKSAPDFDHVVKLFKDRYGIDLSHVRMKWSVHPRYNDGRVSHEFPDDEYGGSHGRLGDDCVVWINPKMRPVMNKFNVPGKVRDFRKLIMAHELAHDIDSRYSRAYSPKFVKKMVEEAKKNNFRTAYTDTYDPVKMPKKFDKELFAEYMAHLLTQPSEKKAEQAPSEEDLRRMYDIVQSDAKLTRRIEGLGFGRDGDAYRKAAIRLRVMELAKVLRDGKRVRNRIVHAPGYIPSKQDADRALQQYADAHAGLTRFLNGGEKSAEIELRDGKYSDVKKIYDALTDKDKEFLTPGRRAYVDSPSLLTRSVAYDGRRPVGFADLYPGKHKNFASLCVAVSDNARGKGIAGDMAKDAIRKLILQIERNRIKAELEGGESLKKYKDLPTLEGFQWILKKDNLPSARAAEKAGFKEKFIFSPRWRKFQMPREDAERMTQEDK